MLCQRCKKNVATVTIKQMINGQYSEKYLCSECAKNEDFSLLNPMDFLTPFASPKKNASRVCKKCGLSAEEFLSDGFLGCPDCYDTFSELVDEMIGQVQKGTRHIGKIPGGNVKLSEKQKLEAELREAVAEEKYLKAAEIREKLDKLQKGDDNNEQ
ncbi:MAG: UvrB/UvrC motif-containing protein [Christensenellales bacterium]